jgi:hypothetical protein
MQFKLLATTTLPLDTQLHWLWYSTQMSSFITGDDRKAFSLPTSSPGAPSPLTSAFPYDDRVPSVHPCDLPIPVSLYEEFAKESWHGFQFLEASSPAYEGDLLRTLTGGPDYGHYMLHPASGLILSFRSGAMELLQRSPTGFTSISKTRTRGRAALAFAAHPKEMLIIYGDNYGNFHGHKFDPTGFGKATKIADKQRSASRADFLNSGQTLMIGGMGYLSTYTYSNGKFAPLHDVSIAVRDFTLTSDANHVLVNQGLHGVTAYRYNQDGFTKTATLEPQGSVNEISISSCNRYLAVSIQDSAAVSIYSISPD